MQHNTDLRRWACVPYVAGEFAGGVTCQTGLAASWPPWHQKQSSDRGLIIRRKLVVKRRAMEGADLKGRWSIACRN
jgi:hypothetical protein